VEVILGAASVVYGADAYAGVVNIITESSTDVIELMYTIYLTNNITMQYLDQTLLLPLKMLPNLLVS